MAVKLYELTPALFNKIESLYPKLAPIELTKINFLFQILMESGMTVEVQIGDNIDLVITAGKLSKEKVSKVTKLGYSINNGRIRVK